MRITCLFCGTRNAQEFIFLGDAGPRRPQGMETSQAAMIEYVYQRDNPAGRHRELWYHGAGCHAWLVVTRDTTNHVIDSVESAKACAKSRKP